MYVDLTVHKCFSHRFLSKRESRALPELARASRDSLWGWRGWLGGRGERGCRMAAGAA